MNIGDGETVTDCSSAAVNVRGRRLLLTVVTPTVKEAWILVGPPTVMPLARPAALTGATAATEEFQTATAVTTKGLPPAVALGVYFVGDPFFDALTGYEK